MPGIPVAVVGLAALMPGARDVAEFWRNIVAGRDLITDVPATHWSADDFYDPDPVAQDKTYGRRGAFLPEIEFDPLAHGLPPATLPALDPAQLLGLVVADELLADLDHGLAGPLDRERVSVILGSSTLGRVGAMDARIQRPVWLAALREQGIAEPEARAVCDRIAARYVPWQEATFPGLLSNVVAGRIANRLDLHGTNCTIDAACASSLAAVAAGINELALGQADLVITGGVDATNNPLMYVCFSKTPALSPTGDVRPFAEDADGTMLGEGVAMLGLKRLDSAEQDGDRIYAVIRGLGSSSDGRGGAIYAPMPQGQVRALRRAYAAAGYGPDTVELVEAHGTATRAGDAAEVESLRQVFGENRKQDGSWCALGTVKSQIGHTKAAAGAAGLVKAVLALYHRVLPPTIKVRQPIAGLDGSPFYLNTAARPWTRSGEHRRRASVSSFGFGGANFHVTLEEHQTTPRFRVAASELVLFSADSPRDLVARMRDSTSPSELARDSQRDFDARSPVRLAVVARDDADLRTTLDQAAALVARSPDAPFSLPGGACYDPGRPDAGRVAFLFPGQGAQYLGMGADVAMANPAAQDVWDLAAGLELGECGLHDVVFPPPVFSDADRTAQERRLTGTSWAQPALAAHSLSLLAMLAAVGIEPACVAGHSLGELVALHAAGVMDAATLVRLTRFRGELMARVDGGAMLAVATDAATLTLGDGLWLANRNAPHQTVVSGAEDAIDALRERLSSDGITARRLAVSAAFHSPLVASVTRPLRAFLDGLSLATPRIDVYANADAQVYDRDLDAVRARLAEHATAPVRFHDQIEAMYAAGVRTFVEVGAGATLTGLVGQILGERDHLAVSLDKRGRDGVTAWHEALARLAVRGVPMDLSGLSRHWVSAPPRPPDRSRMSLPVNGTGYREPVVPIPLESAAMPDPVPVQPVPGPSPEWLAAVAELQRQTAEAHMNFQNVLADAHRSFLHMAETTFAVFAGAPAPAATDLPALPPPPLMAPAAMPQPSMPPTPMPQPMVHAAMPPAPPSMVQPPMPQPMVQALAPMPPTPAPMAMARPPIAPAPLPIAQTPTPIAPAPAAPFSMTPAAPEPAAALDLGLLLEVVADKTGYPVDMLNGGMDLETDLGIDSIKKVEIFAAVRQRVASMPSADSPQMAQLFQLRTLDQIVGRGNGAVRRDPSGNGDPGPPALRRLSLRPVLAPASGQPLPGLTRAPLVVIDGGSGLAPAVVEHLTAHGIAATASDSPEPGTWGVILLNGMHTAANAHRDAFRIARTVAAGMTDRGGVFVTVQDTGGRFGLAGPTHPAVGGLAALARTAALEWPLAAVKAVDCERGTRDERAVAEAIVSELLTGGATLDAGLRADGTRWTVAEVVAAAPEGEPSVTAESVLVATGGARGVTAAALLALAVHRPRMLLVGRTALADEPTELAAAHDEKSLVRLLANEFHTQAAGRAREVLAVREIRATLVALEGAGATVRYAAVDVTDEVALGRELDRTRREWGPITGLVHGAGVLADKLIADKTDDQFDRVYSTKVAGWQALLAATAADPLTLLCVFSSVAARFGNAGQSDYAMANETLNHLACAESVRRPSCLVRSIGWGPWDGGMVTGPLAAHFAQRGVPLIPTGAGARAFVAETAATDAVCVLIDAGTSRDIVVDASTHGYLADHAPAGKPVLPLALAAEWLMAAARRTSLTDLRVLRRVELPDLAAGGHRLTIEEGAAELRLSSAGHAHYRARLAGASSTRTWPALDGPSVEGVYDHPALFHGPGFQTLQRLDALSADGADARVVGVRVMGWPGGPWWTDPAAVDGALQAAVLWAHRATGHATLPMAVDVLRVHRTGPAPGPLRCLVRGHTVSDGQSRCDIALLDGDGEPRAELVGVSLIRRPDMSGT
jgi:acyl transferase domain-containing protein/NADP-dependent 3-hydroxy acid dehydrogenase YdfG